MSIIIKIIIFHNYKKKKHLIKNREQEEKRREREKRINFRNVELHAIYLRVSHNKYRITGIKRRENAESEGRGRIFDRTRAKLPVSDDRKLETNF